MTFRTTTDMTDEIRLRAAGALASANDRLAEQVSTPDRGATR
jgi:hypothetical protein